MQETIMDESSVATPTTIDAIEQELTRKIGSQKFRIWFKDSASITLDDGYLKIGVPNTFTARWIENHFLADLQSVTERITGQCHKVTFSVSPLAQANTPVGSAARSTPTHTPPAKAAPFKPKPASTQPKLRLALDTFVVGQSNELAYNAAQVVIREQDSPFNPLFIHGGYGVGKTHLLQGVCNAIRQVRPNTQWMYLSAEDFANQFVLALKTKKLEAFRRRMRNTDLLAIDDIHFLTNKPSTQEEFLHTFNTINLAGKQVILVSDAAPKMIRQLSDKLTNRFVSGMVVKIDTPDFTTRCKICEQCARTMVPSTYKGMMPQTEKTPKVPESVIHFIAQNIRSNVRELEGALLKVIAFSALQNGPITLALAKEVLADHVERCDPMVHLSSIESSVAEYFGTTPAIIHSTKKDKTVAMARHFSMYLARKHTKMSSSEIGRLMGNKNHATVLVACKKLDDMVNRDAEIHWRGPTGNKVSTTKTTLMALESSISK
jgi:chromosomal replication initiator protein